MLYDYAYYSSHYAICGKDDPTKNGNLIWNAIRLEDFTSRFLAFLQLLLTKFVHFQSHVLELCNWISHITCKPRPGIEKHCRLECKRVKIVIFKFIKLDYILFKFILLIINQIKYLKILDWLLTIYKIIKKLKVTFIKQ